MGAQKNAKKEELCLKISDPNMHCLFYQGNA